MGENLTFEITMKLLRDTSQKSEVILFINIKDWLVARREMRKDGNIACWRVGRTSTLKLFYRGSFIADVCVGMKNQFLVPDGKFLQMPKPDLLSQKIKVEFPSQPVCNSGRLTQNPYHPQIPNNLIS